MSNFNVSQSSQETKHPSVTIGSHRKKPSVPLEKTQASDSEFPPEKPQLSSGKSPEKQSKPLDPSENTDQVQYHIDDRSSQDMRKIERHVPFPQALKETREKIMGKALESGDYLPQTQTVEKTGLTQVKTQYIQDSQTLSEHVQNSSPMDLDGLLKQGLSHEQSQFETELKPFLKPGSTDKQLKRYGSMWISVGMRE